MSGEWEKDTSGLTLADVEAYNRRAYRLVPHHFGTRKRMPWPVCKSCGLISLRNRFSQWCEKMGCEHERHPEYASRARSSAPRSP